MLNPCRSATTSQRHLIAGTSKTDLRSVGKYLRGSPVRGLVRERIEEALFLLKLLHLLRRPEPLGPGADAEARFPSAPREDGEPR